VAGAASDNGAPPGDGEAARDEERSTGDDNRVVRRCAEEQRDC